MSSRAEALVDRADELEQCGQPQAACRAYQAALHLDPHCRAAAVNLGVLLKCVDRLPACRAAHRHAAALHAQLRLNEPQRLCDGGTGMLKAAVLSSATTGGLGLLSSWCLAASGWLAQLAHSQGSNSAAQPLSHAMSAHLTYTGGPTFGMGECAPAQLASAAAVLRQALHAGGYGSRTARRLLRLHGGSEADAEGDDGDDAAPLVVGIAEGGAGHELCSTGRLAHVEDGRPEACANSPSSSPRQRQVKRRAASSLGQPRPI